MLLLNQKDSIIYYLEQFRKDDIKDIDCQRLIINTLIDTIIIDEENDRELSHIVIMMTITAPENSQ